MLNDILSAALIVIWFFGGQSDMVLIAAAIFSVAASIEEVRYKINKKATNNEGGDV